VSNFGRSVVLSQSRLRVLDMEAMNPELVQRVAKLRLAIEWKRKAVTVFPYVLTCSVRETIKALVDKVEQWSEASEPPFSLNDLCAVRQGTFAKELKGVVDECVRHVLACSAGSCRQRGHLCEACRSDEVLFPFQPAAQVASCDGCGAVYHRRCKEIAEKGGHTGCGRCRRREERRRARTEEESFKL